MPACLRDVRAFVVFFGRLYSRTAVNYCTTRKKLLAMVEALRQSRPYVLGRHFASGPITWLCSGFRVPPTW